MNQLAIEAIRQMIQINEKAVTPGFCEDALGIMIDTALQADPNVEISILEHVGAGNHKALLINNQVVNISPAALYPEYIGPLETAPLTFTQMTKKPLLQKI